jgi:hypothetical protein
VAESAGNKEGLLRSSSSERDAGEEAFDEVGELNNQYYDSQDMGDEDEEGGLSPINLPQEDFKDEDEGGEENEDAELAAQE